MKARDLQASRKNGAGCLIMAKDTNRFLLIQRSDYVASPRSWGLPGGKVEPGERPLEAAKREALEEIGFQIGSCPMRLIYTNDAHAPRFRFYTYACVVGSEFEPTLNWESIAYLWCGTDDLPEPLHWGVHQMLNHDKAARIMKKFMDEQRKA